MDQAAAKPAIVPKQSRTRPPLRLWPGLTAAVLLLLSRFALKALVPGFEGFQLAIFGSFACTGIILLWWLLFSRAAWLDRACAIVLMLASLGVTWYARHESMGPAWMFAYAVPLVMVDFVAAAFVVRAASGLRKSRVILAAAILLSSLGWTLLRTEGIDGDHNATFAWRWSATREQKLLQASPLATAAVTPALPSPASEPTVNKPATAAPDADRPAAPPPAPVITPPAVAEWPGFRGPSRDSVVRGITIATNWSEAPPTAVWRKPVGPGWSSFAVQDGRFYTQEQRGEEELVAAYQASTGEPVWSHADPVRFFESNAGAGPRATPTLAQGRVYTLGATGILNVLDAATGKRIWTRNTTADTRRRIPDWGFSASPVVSRDGRLVIVYAGRLAAYDTANGNLKWLGEAVGGSYSSPQMATVDGVEQLLILSPQGASSVDPETGKALWIHEWKGLPIVQPALLPSGNGLLISASQADGTRRIDPVRGSASDGTWKVETRWTSLALKPYFNDTVIHKDHAFGFDARILTCIDLAEGKRVWKGGRYGNGQMLLLAEQNLLLVLSEDGELALVEASPAGFREIAKLPALEGKTWNHPVLIPSTGLLLVRNAQEMAAFRLATAPAASQPLALK